MMTKYTHKMENGQLVELTPEEIAEAEEREKIPPPSWLTETTATPEPTEPPDAPRRAKRH